MRKTHNFKNQNPYHSKWNNHCGSHTSKAFPKQKQKYKNAKFLEQI